MSLTDKQLSLKLLSSELKGNGNQEKEEILTELDEFYGLQDQQCELGSKEEVKWD